MVLKEDTGQRGKAVTYSLSELGKKKASLFVATRITLQDKSTYGFLEAYHAILLFDEKRPKFVSLAELEDIISRQGKKLDEFKEDEPWQDGDERGWNCTLSPYIEFILIEEKVKCKSCGCEEYVFSRALVTGPGIAAKDFTNVYVRHLYHNRFSDAQIRRALDCLESEGYLTRVESFDSEIRYAIADSHLRDFTHSLSMLIFYERNLRYLFWSSVKRPTADEVDWLTFLGGDQDAQSSLDFYALQRRKCTETNRETALEQATKLELEIREKRIQVISDMKLMINEYPELSEVFLKSLPKDVIKSMNC
ncbi:MAG: hypothetical protein ABI361_12765 [Nitrososphaera sp.]